MRFTQYQLVGQKSFGLGIESLFVIPFIVIFACDSHLGPPQGTDLNLNLKSRLKPTSWLLAPIYLVDREASNSNYPLSF